jgi:predicted metalloprotease with PDZ domain
LGIAINKNQGKILIAQVLADGAAASSGLSVGDELIAINQNKIDADSYDKIVKKCKAGQKVQVHVFRQDQLKVMEVIVEASPKDTVEITVKPDLTDLEKKLLTSWLQIDL